MIKEIASVLVALGTLSASAWICEKCGAAVDDDYGYCDRTGCGARKPSPEPAYTPPLVHTSRPEYTPQSATAPDEVEEWHNGKLVKSAPMHIGLFGPEVALPAGEHYSVCGLCINSLVAKVVNTYGLQIGGSAALVETGCGLQTGGGIALANKSMYGLQAGSLLACANKSMYGLQMGGVFASSKELTGVQIGSFAITERSMYGLQIGGVFASSKELTGVQIAGVDFTKRGDGVQIGVINKAETFYGVQIGVVNKAETFYGVQIGAINLIEYSTVNFMPVVNVRF